MSLFGELNNLSGKTYYGSYGGSCSFFEVLKLTLSAIPKITYFGGALTVNLR
ncbi:MAG: hypothetical protein ACTS4X_01310 [Candidatus Hodgkinia cicadicola]